MTEKMKPTVKNKITEKWKRKVANQSGILDTGCTSKKVFMLPDKSKIPATKIMRLKHNL